MELDVNGETRTIDGEFDTLRELLEILDIEHLEGLAVAVNGEVVPDSEWTRPVELEEGDRLDIVRATQGG